MSSCTRFEDEALLILEQGGTLDEHFETCEDCVAARIAYEKLTGALRNAVKDEQPPAGWERRVLDHMGKTRTRSQRRQLAWAGLAASFLAAVLTAHLFWPSGDTLDLSVVHGSTVYRGSELQSEPRLGDTLVLNARSRGAFTDLRVYFESRLLVVSCHDGTSCVRRGNSIKAQLQLGVRGEYIAVLMVSETPLPTTTNDLEADLSSARSAGASLVVSEPISVH